MALFVFIALVIQNCFPCIVGIQIEDRVPRTQLQITPSNLTAGRYFGLYVAGDNLNLSCNYPNEHPKVHVALDWQFPKTFNRSNSVVNQVGSNLINLMIDNLTECDSGEYKCTAFVESLLKSESLSIQINVKPKKGGCSDTMFQCSYGICISKIFTCDGYKDCPLGDDELSNHCGSRNPCEKKVMCPDGRCIPYAWCCDPERDQNCTIKVKHKCCIHMERLTRYINSDLGFPYEKHNFNDMGFVGNLLHRFPTNSTTIYTVMGCAFSFLFIVTVIILIKTCRTKLSRSVISRCPAANRNLSVLRSSNLRANHLNYLPFYDFNRSGCNSTDIMSVNPLVVTYNINNGVQFVGRPIDPPPYCEILTSPPREGPPPPYASQESLYPKRRDEDVQERNGLDAGVENDDNESDTLLDSRNGISVISCNAIDGTEILEESADAGLHAKEEPVGINAN